MNEKIAQLVTTKPDKEVAQELKTELIESAKAYLDVCTKAHGLGFAVASQFQINAFGQCVITSLTLSKHY